MLYLLCLPPGYSPQAGEASPSEAWCTPWIPVCSPPATKRVPRNQSLNEGHRDVIVPVISWGSVVPWTPPVICVWEPPGWTGERFRCSVAQESPAFAKGLQCVFFWLTLGQLQTVLKARGPQVLSVMGAQAQGLLPVHCSYVCSLALLTSSCLTFLICVMGTSCHWRC